jgi:uncharacterized protein involved in exopolysaccharide biosynthesis
LQQFGTAVWARINGRDPTTVSDDENSSQVGGHGGKAAVTAKIEDTPQIREARKQLNDLNSELYVTETAHTKLLNSGTYWNRKQGRVAHMKQLLTSPSPALW